MSKQQLRMVASNSATVLFLYPAASCQIASTAKECKMPSRVLVACEKSQIVTKAFRGYGAEAYSCDILPTVSDNPEWHLQQDARQLLKEKWDLIIAFPPCTYLCAAGSKWFDVGHFGREAIERKRKREAAIDFFLGFYYAPCSRVAIENPVGFMGTEWKKPTQVIQPFQFGHAVKKKTCLWLKNLPKLFPTKIVQPPPDLVMPNGKKMSAWYFDSWNAKHKDIAYYRSKTFVGIAEAMASQWMPLIENKSRNPYFRPKKIIRSHLLRNALRQPCTHSTNTKTQKLNT